MRRRQFITLLGGTAAAARATSRPCSCTTLVQALCSGRSGSLQPQCCRRARRRGSSARRRAQEAQLRAAACTKIYAEKVSGAWSDRPALAKLLKRLDQGDVCLGRHDDTARPPHADGAWGTRRVRARANHRPHRRGLAPAGRAESRSAILDAVGKAGAGFKSLNDDEQRPVA
jgi:resolvase-like protein